VCCVFTIIYLLGIVRATHRHVHKVLPFSKKQTGPVATDRDLRTIKGALVGELDATTLNAETIIVDATDGLDLIRVKFNLFPLDVSFNLVNNVSDRYID
jgi:hypothetical protein